MIAYKPTYEIDRVCYNDALKAQAILSEIRNWLSNSVSKEVAQKTRILYGGSVRVNGSWDIIK